MRALTLWRPWDWAIVHGHKPVENRDWKPFEGLLGATIAIHSGKTYDDAGRDFIGKILGHRAFVPGADQWWGGYIAGTARLHGWVTVNDRCGVTENEARELRASPWFMGEYGWVLRDAKPLRDRVSCRGAQGLWTLDAATEARVRAQMEAARG